MQKARSAAVVAAGTTGLVFTATALLGSGIAGKDARSAQQTAAPQASLQQAKRPTHHSNMLRGVASWYSDLFEGKQTASGEVFRQAAMTACHRTLPFGTLVRVINLRNHRSVVVRINDRGDLHPGRVIDLSSAAADRLGILEAGLAMVRLEIIALPVHG